MVIRAIMKPVIGCTVLISSYVYYGASFMAGFVTGNTDTVGASKITTKIQF